MLRSSLTIASIPKTWSLSETRRPSASKILRFVSKRQGRPASMRSIVNEERPALRASSALLIIKLSRYRCTLFLGTTDPPQNRIQDVSMSGATRQSVVSAPSFNDLSPASSSALSRERAQTLRQFVSGISPSACKSVSPVTSIRDVQVECGSFPSWLSHGVPITGEQSRCSAWLAGALVARTPIKSCHPGKAEPND